MDEITFLVQGSASEPYTVQFKKSGNNLSAYCTCPAGAVGQICKHRMRILDGDTEGIVSGNETEVAKAASWLAGSNVEAAMLELRASETRLEAAQKEVSALKKKLARALVS
jgi:hypothetical protein